MTPEWSVNELAARAIALHARTPAEARELLDMCGLLAGDRITPDDTRVHHLAPIVAKQETHEPALTRRDKGVRAPAGLAALPPEQPAPPRARPRKTRSPRPVAECGSPSGYRRHQKNGEPICEPCRVARNEKHREYEKARRERRRRGEAA